jgi:serine/threonine protein phosphatase PrpC
MEFRNRAQSPPPTATHFNEFFPVVVGEPVTPIIKFVSLGMTETGARPNNEDRFVETPFEDGQLIGIFDGHTGSETVDILSSNLIKVVKRLSAIEDWSNRLFQAMTQLEMMLPNYGPSGSTALVAFIQNTGDVYIANIGDCRAFIAIDGAIVDRSADTHFVVKDPSAQVLRTKGINPYNYDNHISLQTRPHRVDTLNPEVDYYKSFGYTVKGGYISNVEGSRQIQLTRSLGDIHYPHMIKVPELYHWRLTPSQALKADIVLVSDGFESNNVLSIEKIAQLLHNPLKTLSDFPGLLKGSIIGGYFDELGYSPHSPIEVNLDRLHAKGLQLVAPDKAWQASMISGYREVLSLIEKLRQGDMTLETRLKLVVSLGKLLGSDDNLTIIVTRSNF